MIETTIKQVDGLNFVIDVKLVPPFEYRNGVRVELVSSRMSVEAPEFKLILTALGFELVDFDGCTNSYIYAQLPYRFIQYKVARFLLRFYWWSIRSLYDNARMFKQIPQGERFSWRYFTLYVWFSIIRSKIRYLTS
jgi:hypothetical protein